MGLLVFGHQSEMTGMLADMQSRNGIHWTACVVIVLVVIPGPGFGAKGSWGLEERGVADWVQDFRERLGGDPLFERLVAQIWSVHRSSMKENSTMYGTQIDPINMDEKMGPMDIPVQQGFIKSNARIQGIEIHGMSSAALEKSEMKRKEHLDDMDMEVKFKFDNLFINGTYRIETMGVVIIPRNYWSIRLSGCFLSYMMQLALLDMAKAATGQSQSNNNTENQKNQCTKSDDPMVQLLEFALPLDCKALDFNFFGAADAIVEILGLTIVKQIVGFATNVARDQINFLLCSGDKVAEKVFSSN